MTNPDPFECEPEARWYWKDDDGKWQKYRKLDSDLIEITSQSGGDKVKILDGEYEASVKNREQRKTIGGESRKIMRATWFIEEDVRDSKGKLVYTPLEEDVCEQLSEAYLTEQWGVRIDIGDRYFILSRAGPGRMFSKTSPQSEKKLVRGYRGRTLPQESRSRLFEDFQSTPPQKDDFVSSAYAITPPIQDREPPPSDPLPSKFVHTSVPPSRSINSVSSSTSSLPTLPATASSTPSVTPTVTTASALPATRPPGIFLEGHLQRLNNIHLWSNRWFCLNDNSLAYYNNKRRDKELGRIPLTQITKAEMAPPGKHGQGAIFYVHTTKKTLCLKAATLKDAEAWVDAIMNNKTGGGNKLPTEPQPKVIQNTTVETVPASTVTTNTQPMSAPSILLTGAVNTAPPAANTPPATASLNPFRQSPAGSFPGSVDPPRSMTPPPPQTMNTLNPQMNATGTLPRRYSGPVDPTLPWQQSLQNQMPTPQSLNAAYSSMPPNASVNLNQFGPPPSPGLNSSPGGYNQPMFAGMTPQSTASVPQSNYYNSVPADYNQSGAYGIQSGYNWQQQPLQPSQTYGSPSGLGNGSSRLGGGGGYMQPQQPSNFIPSSPNFGRRDFPPTQMSAPFATTNNIGVGGGNVGTVTNDFAALNLSSNPMSGASANQAYFNYNTNGNPPQVNASVQPAYMTNPLLINAQPGTQQPILPQYRTN